MGFLTKLFTNKREGFLIEMIKSLERDKTILQEQIKDKDQLIKELITKGGLTPVKEVKEIIPLTKLEQSILDTFNKNKDIKKTAKILKLKENSLKVYFSKIRRKGFKI